MTVSDSNFYKKVTDKYRYKKSNFIKYPALLFYKHNAAALSNKINLGILFQLNFNVSGLSSTYSFLANVIQEMKQQFSWFAVEKFFPQFIFKPIVLKNLPGLKKLFDDEQDNSAAKLFSFSQIPISNANLISYMQSAFSKIKNKKLGANKIPQALSLSSNRLPQETIHSTFLNSKYKSYLNLNRISVSQNILQTSFAGGKNSLMSSYNNDLNSENLSKRASSKRINFKGKDENLFLFNPQKIKEEVENIKKMVNETKETIANKSSSTVFPLENEIKKHIDINRISDKVYQNIERRIRIEKERRGL